MKNHVVKSWSHFFQAIKAGTKTHDLRYKGDRDYNVNDIVTFQEYDFINGKYTGNEISCVITYITDNKTPCAFSSAVLHKDYCILSIRLLNKEPSSIVLDSGIFKKSEHGASLAAIAVPIKVPDAGKKGRVN